MAPYVSDCFDVYVDHGRCALGFCESPGHSTEDSHHFASAFHVGSGSLIVDWLSQEALAVLVHQCTRLLGFRLWHRREPRSHLVKAAANLYGVDHRPLGVTA